MAAAPLNKINRPKAFVNLSSPKRSTRIIDVNEIYPAGIKIVRYHARFSREH